MRQTFDRLKQTGQMHHAYLVIGNRGSALDQIKEELVTYLGLKSLVSHPDVWLEDFEAVGISESRLLKERQSRRPLIAGRQFFVWGVGSITAEAQNALLKTFEEPTTNSHFFLVAEEEEMFLPTLRSRCQVIRHSQAADAPDDLAQRFLFGDIAERMKLAEKVADRGRQPALEFVRQVETGLHQELIPSPDNLLAYDGLSTALRWLKSRSSSPKLVLEYLAFRLPLLKLAEKKSL
jgi:hypothetical protein